MTTETALQAQETGQPPIALDPQSPQKMVLLLETFAKQFAGGSPFMAMLPAMIPLAKGTIGKIDPANVQALARMLAEAFIKVADPEVSVEGMQEWVSQLAAASAESA